MTTRNGLRQLRRGGAVLAAALLVACTPPATLSPTAASSPCADPTYVALRQQHPDSLSVREWERLQSLDRACTTAGAQARGDGHGMSGSMHGHWMGAGIATVIMVAMMISMW